jgi:exodeoxyribonuclease VII small subunit
MKKVEEKYKAAFTRLEEIQGLLENDALDVDELAVVLKEASGLLKFCNARLHEVNEETNLIIKNIQS